jgi:hypothetical protein
VRDIFRRCDPLVHRRSPQSGLGAVLEISSKRFWQASAW